MQPPLTRYLVKRLMNHSVRGDVTGGYIHVDTENLRGPMQAIADFVYAAAEPAPARAALAANDAAWSSGSFPGPRKRQSVD